MRAYCLDACRHIDKIKGLSGIAGYLTSGYCYAIIILESIVRGISLDQLLVQFLTVKWFAFKRDERSWLAKIFI